VPRTWLRRQHVAFVIAGGRAFGPEVVAHYANMARVELDAYNAAVT